MQALQFVLAVWPYLTVATVSASSNVPGAGLWLGVEIFLARLADKVKEAYPPAQFYEILNEENLSARESMDALIFDQCHQLARPIFSSVLCESLVALRSSGYLDIFNSEAKDTIVAVLVQNLLQKVNDGSELGGDANDDMLAFVTNFAKTLSENPGSATLSRLKTSLTSPAGRQGIKQACLDSSPPTDSADDTCNALLGVLKSSKWQGRPSVSLAGEQAVQKELAKDVQDALVWGQDCGPSLDGEDILDGDETDAIDSFFSQLHDWLSENKQTGLSHARGTHEADHGNNTLDLLEFCLTERSTALSTHCRKTSCQRAALAYGRFFEGIPLFPFNQILSNNTQMKPLQPGLQVSPHPVLRSLILCILLLERIDAVELLSRPPFAPAFPQVRYPSAPTTDVPGTSSDSSVFSVSSAGEASSGAGQAGQEQASQLHKALADLEQQIASLEAQLLSGKGQPQTATDLGIALEQKGKLQSKLSELQISPEEEPERTDSSDRPAGAGAICETEAGWGVAEQGYSRKEAVTVELHFLLDLKIVTYTQRDRSVFSAQLQDDLSAALGCPANRFRVRDFSELNGLAPAFKAHVEILSPNWVMEQPDHPANDCASRSSTQLAAELKVMGRDITSPLYYQSATCHTWIGPRLAIDDPVRLEGHRRP
eukprot:gb/GEZN01003181.1/.p1 GENE.gb/GEZN01003181.1/~~gb/GEZN01003181.1/.p1  ORF type:complete len:655 (+),score=121.68 gb/GEZN01003181.1/:50-2014(+)